LNRSDLHKEPFELSQEQRFLVQTVFDSWRASGKWPKWTYVRYELKSHRLDAASLLRTMPGGLVAGLRLDYPQATDYIQVTMSAITYCERAQALRQALWDLLQLALVADSSYRPDPSQDHGPEVSQIEIVKAGVPETMLQPLSEVLDHWVGILIRPGSEGEWVFRVDPGVERFHGVKDLDDYVARTAAWLRAPVGRKSGPRQIFVLMPFKDEQQPVYEAIRNAVAAVDGYTCQRSDDITTPGRISFQIINAITNCDVVVADLAGHNPNVMYELGYAHAAEKPTILLAPKGYKSPFDLYDWRYIGYSLGELDKLTAKLEAWLQEPTILSKLPASST
jgi:hypothetical protein